MECCMRGERITDETRVNVEYLEALCGLGSDYSFNCNHTTKVLSSWILNASINWICMLYRGTGCGVRGRRALHLLAHTCVLLPEGEFPSPRVSDHSRLHEEQLWSACLPERKHLTSFQSRAGIPLFFFFRWRTARHFWNQVASNSIWKRIEQCYVAMLPRLDNPSWTRCFLYHCILWISSRWTTPFALLRYTTWWKCILRLSNPLCIRELQEIHPGLKLASCVFFLNYFSYYEIEGTLEIEHKWSKWDKFTQFPNAMDLFILCRLFSARTYPQREPIYLWGVT